MSKNSSVAFLVKAIIEKDPDMIRVKDSVLVSYYASNSRYMIELEPEDKKKFNIFTEKTGQIEDDFENLGEMQRDFAKEIGANYIFTSYLYPPSARLTAVATPFMIISENEIDFLVKKYYKDVPEGISRAASDLGIKLYEKEYRDYSNLEFSRELDLILNRKDDNQISDFFSIIFSLPYEEQNITANKAIFKSYTDYFDYTKVLAREYSQGKYFQEYFESLSHNKKLMVAYRIETLEQRNLNNDIFLIKERFFVKGANPIDLYKNDTESFIKYFKGGLNLESQKFLIEEIYKESFVNEEIVEWLEENYAHLLREVGFTGGN